MPWIQPVTQLSKHSICHQVGQHNQIRNLLRTSLYIKHCKGGRHNQARCTGPTLNGAVMRGESAAVATRCSLAAVEGRTFI